MSSAQLDMQQPDDAGFDDLTSAPAPFALQQQAAERIAAHRARRQNASASAAPAIAIARSPARARAARVAAAVAERYANSPSYRAVLAAEAEKAIQQAEAAADIAALNAQAVAEAQYSLLAELDQLSSPPAIATPTPAPTPATPATLQSPTHRLAITLPVAGATVRLLEHLTDHKQDLAHSFTNSYNLTSPDPLDDENLTLDDEIAFRHAPSFEPSNPPQEIPANLIEFPRQLVAARRARPRIAEGPLRDEIDPQHHAAQLRIFEVEATQISPVPSDPSSDTEWSSIVLDAHPAAPQDHARHLSLHAQDYAPETDADLNPDLPPQAAPFNLRLMATAVDTCIILTSFVAFIAVFALIVGSLSPVQLNLQTLGTAAAATLILLATLYQLLFFTLADATPGMRYARIALCTFSDENPSRSAMRRRVFAIFLSVCPLGIGILWAGLDPDRLGWHDRISRMYQRSY